MLRDNYLNVEYFESLLLERIKLAGEDAQEYFDNKMDCELISSAAQMQISICRASYAKGEGLELSNYFTSFLEYLFLSEKCFETVGERHSRNDIDLTSVRFVLSAIVYGKCLGFSHSDLTKMAECIPYGIEQLVDRLLSHYQPEREISEVLKEKGKYKQLIEIMNSDDKAFQAKKLKNYLDQWPKKLGIRAPDGIRPLHETPTYDGYWCYEAAAVVIVCGIDDESFRDHEFYPADLMSWRNNDQ